MTQTLSDFEKSRRYILKIARRFYASIERDEATGCLNWIGERNPRGGYGRFKMFGKNWVAHRASWFMAGLTIPDGMQLDHLCRNTRCVEITHLEPVTCAENVQRGWRAREATA